MKKSPYIKNDSEMVIAKEITDWNFSNHTYLLTKNKMKCHGYWKNHHEYIRFSVPFQFNKARRQFQYTKIVWQSYENGL